MIVMARILPIPGTVVNSPYSALGLHCLSAKPSKDLIAAPWQRISSSAFLCSITRREVFISHQPLGDRWFKGNCW